MKFASASKFEAESSLLATVGTVALLDLIGQAAKAGIPQETVAEHIRPAQLKTAGCQQFSTYIAR
jgi:hypothetical protein